MNVPWTQASGDAIGAGWLAEALAPVGELGRRARRASRAFRAGDDEAARTALAAVARAATALSPAALQALRSALGAAPDPGDIVARALAGAVLSDVDFFELTRFLDALGAIDAAGRAPLEGIIAVPVPDAHLAAILAPGRTPARSFYLDDTFDDELLRARGLAAAAQAAYDGARSTLEARVAAALGLEHVREGEFVVMRDALHGPLPPDVRVLHEASTYLLCELSLDEFAFAALAERDRAATYVATAEETVRARLTVAVRAAGDGLRRACAELGALDDFLARVAFVQRFDAVVPEIAGEPLLAFEDARYLPLADTLRAHGLAYEPISLELRGAGVLSGPNMGGKTATLRACGFLAACVAFGVPVPAKNARIALFDEIVWLGIGADASGGGLLSAFGAEIVEVRDCLERAARRPLVLVDELARTTSPAEGRALLIALLEHLASQGAVALAATHYADVAQAARVAHYAIAGLHGALETSGRRLALDDALRRIAQAMDYRIRRVDAGEPVRSDAFALAEALGLPAPVLARAREAL